MSFGMPPFANRYDNTLSGFGQHTYCGPSYAFYKYFPGQINDTEFGVKKR
ncbi:MAG: hypothetical protein HHJ11_07665 [Phycicoccus sp.]|nr:hypothetical protein [Phycicoccus sp.]NMM35836.1 hypothetical protein [Phycicoccus sp.]